MDEIRPLCAATSTLPFPPPQMTPVERMHTELHKLEDALRRANDGVREECPVEFWAPYTLGQLQRVRYYAENAMRAIEQAWNRDDALPLDEDGDEVLEPTPLVQHQADAGPTKGGAA